MGRGGVEVWRVRRDGGVQQSRSLLWLTGFSVSFWMLWGTMTGCPSTPPYCSARPLVSVRLIDGKIDIKSKHIALVGCFTALRIKFVPWYTGAG